MDYYINDLEKNFEYIPSSLKEEVREFLDEYHEKSESHTVYSLEGLNESELSELLYIDLSETDEDKLILEKLKLCKMVKTLRLNRIEEDIAFLNTLTSLRILVITEVNFENSTEIISGLKNLFTLSIYDCSSKYDFAIELKNHNNILALYIDHESNLNELYYYNKLLRSIPDSLSNLLILKIENQANLEEFNFANLNNLVELSLINCGVNEFPRSVLNCLSLKEIKVYENKIKKIPEEISYLKNLEIF